MSCLVLKESHRVASILIEFGSVYKFSTQGLILKNFRKKKLRIGGGENLSFWVGYFDFFPTKSVSIYNVARVGQNFDDYLDFQLTIRCAYKFATECISKNRTSLMDAPIF